MVQFRDTSFRDTASCHSENEGISSIVRAQGKYNRYSVPMNATNRIIGSMVKKKDNLIQKRTENTGSKGKGTKF